MNGFTPVFFTCPTCEFDQQDYNARCKNCPKVGLQYEARQVILLVPFTYILFYNIKNYHLEVLEIVKHGL